MINVRIRVRMVVGSKVVLTGDVRRKSPGEKYPTPAHTQPAACFTGR